MTPPTPQPPMPPMEAPHEEPMIDDPMSDADMGDGGAEMSDPKKSIQQLVGKLSQELRTYNNEQEAQDTDLNKYVAGMIIPQATKIMTDQDKNEVINKIKKGQTDSANSSDEPMSDEDEPIVNEVINSLLDKKKDKRFDKDITNKDVRNKTNPFKTNR
jgi:hypothetical protein